MKTTTFAVISGVAYLALGLLGLVPAMFVSPPMDAPPTTFTVLYGYLLGLFPMNILHTALNLMVGLWGIAAWSGATSPVRYARSMAVLFGVLAVMGLLPHLNTVFGIMPVYGHDVWLHAISAVAAAYFVWRHAAGTARERRRIRADRRHQMASVAHERRFGLDDRREHFGGMSPA